jgi:hypothetical protein
MSESIDTTYVVQISVKSPQDAGRAAAAAGNAGFTEVRFSVLENSQRRALDQDELGATLQVLARATDARLRAGSASAP